MFLSRHGSTFEDDEFVGGVGGGQVAVLVDDGEGDGDELEVVGLLLDGSEV